MPRHYKLHKGLPLLRRKVSVVFPPFIEAKQQEAHNRELSFYLYRAILMRNGFIAGLERELK